MKWQRLFQVLTGLVLLLGGGCSPTVPSATATPPAATTQAPVPTDTETATETATPTPSPTSTAAPQPAAPPQYQSGDLIELDEIHMLDASQGWALSGPTVLATTDGGESWLEATPPEALPPGATAKAYGAFLDAQTAWVVFAIDGQIAPEAVVWHSADGGRTWAPSKPLLHEAFGDTVWAEFDTLDAENLWLLVRGVYAGAGTHYTAQLFNTLDGGATWDPIAGDTDLNWDFTGMAFADADNGWLTWQTTGAYAPGPPAYAVTSDGGERWESRELPAPADTRDFFEQYEYCEPYQPNLLSADSVRLLVGCFDYYHPPREFTSYLYLSDDGGYTWETVQLPAPVLAAQSTLIYFDANHALLLSREMYRSDDGGRTWSHVKTVNWDGQFSFVDPQQGWAIASSDEGTALVNTVDGGGTWALIKPEIGENASRSP